METNSRTIVLNRLQILRERSRLTKTEVANMLGVTIGVVSHHENYHRGISHQNILKYARIYKCYTYEIFVDAQYTEDTWVEDGENPVNIETAMAGVD